jgi:hypothetical protein
MKIISGKGLKEELLDNITLGLQEFINDFYNIVFY